MIRRLINTTNSQTCKSFRLTSRERKGESQQWRHSIDWVLTDFSTEPPDADGHPLPSNPQTLPAAFGFSDFNADFWGRYNTVAIDSLPLPVFRIETPKSPFLPM